MKRLFLLLFFFIFSTFLSAQPTVFQGRVDFGSDLASFEKNPPVEGTLYLLTGAAAGIKILSQKPFLAEVDFVQGEWRDESNLLAHRIVLRFEGASWLGRVVPKKPREGVETSIYPYRKFQVAAIPTTGGFRVIAVPILF